MLKAPYRPQRKSLALQQHLGWGSRVQQASAHTYLDSSFPSHSKWQGSEPSNPLTLLTVDYSAKKSSRGGGGWGRRLHASGLQSRVQLSLGRLEISLRRLGGTSVLAACKKRGVHKWGLARNNMNGFLRRWAPLYPLDWLSLWASTYLSCGP